MITKDSLIQFLQSECGEIKQQLFEFHFSEKFELIVKCKLGEHNEDYSGFCKTFIEHFSTFSNTNWIVRSTFPKLQRLAFRKIFKCQHSAFNKKSQRTSGPGPSRVRSRGCNATIDFKFKKVNRNTCRYDADLKEGYTVLLKINYSHSHLINVAEAYSYLRSTEETDVTFRKYFDSGMSPAAAMALHEMTLIEKYGKESSVYLANSQINPSERHVYYLYENWRKFNFGDKSGLNIDEVLERKLTQLQGKDYIMECRKNPKIIVVISPIMQRIYNSDFIEDMLFIDTTSSCDQNNTAITFVFASSKIGALPVACAFHTSQDEPNYTLVFSMIKEAFEKKYNEKKMNPSIIMTDDSAAERNALKTIFPNSRLLLCCFHVAQAFWRWLSSATHRIDISKRQSIMSRFSKLMFAKTDSEAEKIFEELILDDYVKSCTNLVQHLKKIWERKMEWCTAYRTDIMSRGHNTNNYTEASIRIFKDVILQRCKAFNVCALIDFLSEIFEKYQYRRLMKFAHSRQTNSSAYLKFCNRSKDVTKISRINYTEFLVESSLDKNRTYVVDISTACCNCVDGQGGAFCKHQCAVELKYGLILQTSPKISSADRVTCAKLATDDPLPDEFYQSMVNDDIIVEENANLIQDSEASVNLAIDDICTTTEQPPSNLISEVDDPVFTATYNEALTEMKENFNQLKTILEKHPSSTNLKAIYMFNNSLKNVTTDQQAQNFIFNNFKKGLSRKIRVQPTSVSRRTANNKGTKNRIQAGRPSAEATTAKKSRKRRHDLAFNVSKNINNAR